MRFAIDRAALTGADGLTHYGTFDILYMPCLPNMVVMAPLDEIELIHMVAIAIAMDDRPCCFRYPQGYGIGSILPPNNKGTPLKVFDSIFINLKFLQYLLSFFKIIFTADRTK